MPMSKEKAKTIQGLLLGTATYVIWGVLPLFWVLLSHVNPVETIFQRIFWSFISTGLILFLFLDYKAFLKKIRAMWHEKSQFFLSLACSLLIACNWGVYIWAVVNNMVLDASIGYYINPISTIALGALILKEKLNRTQKLSVLISALGVLVIIVYNGYLPWVSIVLPISFSMYSLAKKKLKLEPMESLFLECFLLMPIVIPALLYFHFTGMSSFAFDKTGLLLLISGPLTALPLYLFAAAVKRINLSDVGIIQYLSPTISFCIGYFVLHETSNISYAIALGLIWIGIFLYLKGFFVNEENK